MAEWSKDLNAWGKRKMKKIKNLRREYTFLLYSEIAKRTPVDTGRARGNWNISKGSIDKSVSENGRIKTRDDVPDSNGDDPYFIANNLPYINKLEYGGYPNPPERGSYDRKSKKWVKKSQNGFSRQAPHGMVGVTVADSSRIFEEALNNIKE